MTSTTGPPPLPSAHQTHAGMAPQLTAFRDRTGAGEVVLFDGNGICMAYAGGEDAQVDTQRQVRAEQASALYNQLLSLAEGVGLHWPGHAHDHAEVITLRHTLNGNPWPVVICRVTLQVGLVADLPPGSATAALGDNPLSGLGYQLTRLAERMRPQVVNT